MTESAVQTFSKLNNINNENASSKIIETKYEEHEQFKYIKIKTLVNQETYQTCLSHYMLASKLYTTLISVHSIDKEKDLQKYIDKTRVEK